MIWSKNDKTGECKFPESNRQDLNRGNEQVEDGVEDKLNENFSLLKHYQKVINIRNKYPFLKNGKYDDMVSELKTSEKSILAYKIYLNEEYIIVVHNFSSYAVEVTSPGNEIVDEINTSTSWIDITIKDEFINTCNSYVTLYKEHSEKMGLYEDYLAFKSGEMSDIEDKHTLEGGKYE